MNKKQTRESNPLEMTQVQSKETTPDEIASALVLRVFRVANLLAEAQTPVVPQCSNRNHSALADKKHKDAIV